MKSPLSKISFALICALALFSGPGLRAESSSKETTDEAVVILKARYFDFSSLRYQEGDNLNSLISRSGGHISLHSPEAAPVPSKIVTAPLPGNILYWRLASFVPETDWSDLGRQVEDSNACANGIILDLRSNGAPDDYHGAGQVLNFFAPADPMFSKLTVVKEVYVNLMATPSDHPVGSPIVVLINGRTSGAAAALAAALKADGAVVIGRPAMAKAAIFEEQKLASGQVLRFVTGPLALANGAGLWDQPVTPDIGITVDEQAEKAALASIECHAIADVMGEAVRRHRLSEAALVQGNDPELDDYLASRERQGDAHPAAKPVPQDVVLVDAIDSLKAIKLSQRKLPLLPPGGSASETSASVQ